MGLTTPVYNYYFYQKYDWTPSDFAAFQSYLLAQLGYYSGGVAQILSGCLAQPTSGLGVSISAGVCLNSSGYGMYIDSTQNVTVASPAGNPAITLIVARPVLTDTNNIVSPTNPNNMVPLLQKQGWSIVVLNGTPGASPVAPATQAGDVILAQLSLTAGIVTLTSANFLWDTVARAGKRSSRVTLLTHANSPYTCDGTEDIIEADCTAGVVAITMASAISTPGKTTRFMKTDSSGNAMTVSASENISGQATQSFDDQWSGGSIYSSGTSFRLLV